MAVVHFPPQLNTDRVTLGRLAMKLLDLENKDSAVVPCPRGYLEATRLRDHLGRVLDKFFKIEIKDSWCIDGYKATDGERVQHCIVATRCE